MPSDGRVRVYALEPRTLEGLSDWVGELSRMWQSQLDAFKDSVERRRKPIGVHQDAGPA